MSHIMNSDIPTIVSAPANTTVSRNRPASSAAARSVSGRAPIRTQSGTSQRPGGSMSGRSWSAASSRSVASSTGSTRPVHVWSRGMKAPLRPGSAAFARPDTAGPDRERRAVDPGRIRPRSAMARHSMGVDGGADDMRSVASTKVPPAVLRPSSPEDLDGYVMEDRVEDASDADFENEMLREEEGEEERPATIRRYFTKGIGPEGKPGVQSHFCVRIPAELPQGHSTNYLRVYYSDFLAVGPADIPVGRDERTVEVDKMATWLLSVEPRSRIDAYPMLLLTKDILRRFVSKDLVVVSGANKRLKEGLTLAENMNRKDRREISRLSGELERVRLRVSELLPLEELAESLRDQVAQGAQKEAAKEQRIAELEVASEAQKVAAERKVDEARRESKEKVEKVMQVRLDKLQAELDATKSKLSKAEDERTAARKEVAVLEEKLRDAVEELRTAKEGDLSCEAVLGAIGTWSPAKRVKLLSGQFAAMGLVQQLHDEFVQNRDKEEQSPLEHATRWLGDMGCLGADGSFVAAAAAGAEHSAKMRALGALLVRHASCASGAGDGITEAAFIDTLLEIAYTSARAAPVAGTGTSGEAADDAVGAEESSEAESKLASGAAGVDAAPGHDTSELAELRAQNEDLRGQVARLQAHFDQSRGIEETERAPSQPKPEATRPPETKKKPGVLKTYDVDPRVFKGKPVKPMAEQAMLRMIADMYENKASADFVDDREHNERQNFPEYLRDHLINRFGLKSIAMTNLQSLILGLRAVKPTTDAGRRLQVFGLCSGIIEHPNWHQDLCNFLLCVLGLVFQISHIKENMDHDSRKKPQIDGMVAIQATQQAWVKYGSGAYPKALHDEMVKAARESGGTLLLHDWVSLIVNTWLASSEKLDKELLAVFKEHDTNGDGVLDLDEFKSMVQALMGGDPVDDMAVAKLFNLSLEESAAMNEGGDASDVMYPSAFCQVARMSGFMAKVMHAGSEPPAATP